ncbi:MAG: gamma-glutamyl-gamma-aminobutyrate hydrolase family protein [Rhodovibrionaceae bacterium]
MTSRPIVGVPACLKEIDELPFHAVGDKYLRAVAEAAEAIPLVIPAFGDEYDIPELLSRLDGLLFTGSPSNVHPSLYGHDATPEHEPHDAARDATTLPLIRAALDAGVPLFAICRGHQELNVALGGTLTPAVHSLPGRSDHRRPKDSDLDIQYGSHQKARLTPGGHLSSLLQSEEIMINSLHRQAIQDLAPRLEVEATAEDGTIEAVWVKDAKDFALGVQWHPEYKALENANSASLFKAFGDRARARAARNAGASELRRQVS